MNARNLLFSALFATTLIAQETAPLLAKSQLNQLADYFGPVPGFTTQVGPDLQAYKAIDGASHIPGLAESL